MLAKVPAKRSDGKTSFKSLAKYACERDHIDPETGEVSRYQCATETNCLDTETAWREMKAVADMNGRVKDPVYHFTVSWPANENPTDQQVFESGKAGIEALGMGEHQYLAAVHRDTDNVHGHFMVNRVNPETYRAVYPDRDYYKLDKVMREVELAQGWSHDNGVYAVHDRNGEKVVDWSKDKHELDRSKTKTPAKARQMEAITNNESLASYVQGQPKIDALETLKQGGSWQHLHTILSLHGLEIRPKGQGLAIYSKEHPDLPPVKASTMGEQFGAGKLTKKLGEYQAPAPTIKALEPATKYSDKKPKRDPKIREQRREERAAERELLRDRYKQYRDEWKAAKLPAKKALYEQQKQRKDSITNEHKKQRESIRTSGLSVPEKKALYSVAAFDIAAKRLELANTIRAERDQLKAEKVKPYRDWVSDRAQDGDKAAIAQIRGFAYADKRNGKHLKKAEHEDTRHGFLVAPDSFDQDPQKPQRISERFTWKIDHNTGSVDYLLNDKTAFSDRGQRIAFTEHGKGDRQAALAGLLLAREKFGQTLDVKGDQEFKDFMLSLAVDNKLDVKFSDPAMEARRQEAMKPKVQPVALEKPQRLMTDQEIKLALSEPRPTEPNQELVEINAINAHAKAYKQQLQDKYLVEHGQRPDPEQGGFIARFTAKHKAEQWDKGFAALDDQVQRRVELLNSADPKAIEFRAKAWDAAVNSYSEKMTTWQANRSAAVAQQAASKPSAETEKAQREKRELEARRLAERQRENSEKQRENKGKDLDFDR
jgi:hypothetical protein